MEDLESVNCVVCSGLAQYAVRTPCCSTLACRVCAIIKRTGECGACHSSPVLVSALVPQQQVRRRVEEVEVWKQVNEKEPTHNNNNSQFDDWQKGLKRTLNDTNGTNMIEPKRMKLNNTGEIIDTNATKDGYHAVGKNESDENRIQAADSTSKWRIIFMDCEKISDGDHEQFTQIGCYVYRRKSSFFLPMYPTKHKEYLQMKQKSDLLRTLHLTLENETGFQFLEPDGQKVEAFSESDGLEEFLNFLQMTSEGEDNVLFLNSPKCILPLLFNKISPNFLQKYVAGICELSSFLSESLDDDDLADLSHTDDIYLRVMGKSFEEMTPTCAQTAKYMFKMVEKISADQGKRNLDFESFISKFFQPTSHFIKKFANLGTSRNENTSGDTVKLEIETSFRPGFEETVEMCKVDLIDLTGPSGETPQSQKSQCSETGQNSQKRQVRKVNLQKWVENRVLTVGNYQLESVKGKTTTILVEFEGISHDIQEVSLTLIQHAQYYVLRNKAIVVEGKYGFLEIGLTMNTIHKITSTPGTHKIPAGTHFLRYEPLSEGSIPLSYEEYLDKFSKCNQKDLHSISNCVDENMSALLMRSSKCSALDRKLPSNVILPVPVPARKTIVQKITKESYGGKIKSLSEQNCIKDSTEPSYRNNPSEPSCSKNPAEASYRNNFPEQYYAKNPPPVVHRVNLVTLISAEISKKEGANRKGTRKKKCSPSDQAKSTTRLLKFQKKLEKKRFLPPSRIWKKLAAEKRRGTADYIQKIVEEQEEAANEGDSEQDDEEDDKEAKGGGNKNK